MQTCNDLGVNLIKGFEKCKLLAYLDQGKVWTIGWGHTGPEVVKGLTWTQQQADQQFVHDLKIIAEDSINDLVKTSLTSNQFSALCSFVYNIGANQFKHSSVLILINKEAYVEVPRHMAVWNHVKGSVSNGLTNRRKAEINLWNMEDQPDSSTTDLMA